MAYSCPEYPCPKPSQDVRRVLHLLHCILEHQRMAKRRLLNVVHVYVSCEENWTDLSEPTTFKSQQQKELNSEVQNIKVDIKASFEETVGALDTFMNYLEAPSEETSEKLKQLCDREKSTGNELLTTREIDETFDVSRSFLIDETRKCQDSNHESFSSEKHSVLELSPPVNSVSREASEKDLEKDCENYFQHNSNEKQHRRENLLQILTTYDNDHDDSIVGYESVGNFENCQERRIKAMENEIHLLRAENREILMELGQITVEKTARENERRKSELFYRVYCSSSSNFVSTSNDKLTTEDEALGHPNNDDNTLQKSPYVNKNPSTSKASGNGFTKPQATNTNADPTSLVSKAISSKRNVQGAESLVKENDHHPGKEEIVTNDKDKRNLHDGGQNGSGILTHNNENENLRTEDLPNIASKKKTSGGEGIDQSGNVTGRSDAASTSRKGSNEQSLNQQSYESLSFSVQQDYSNEKEKISLSNVPPTSVATTLYNNYKLLLLSLGQMLLSNDVTKLMAWATQNFPIVNPQNATHVLFQLDENEVINASDLSQLRHFFESIVRFDLVYVIDTFLLGDYNILRQITASKKRDVNTPQTSQTGTTTRYQNLFNAASNSQFSLRDSSLRAENSNEPQSSVLQQKQQAFPTLVLSNPTPNDAKFVPRSPNENTSSAYGLQSLKSVATGFTASQQVVVDGHVTNERRTTTGNSSTNANSSGTGHPRNTQTIGSNGSRLSTLRRNQEQSDNWLCSHYKRHCYVKFECCDQFWPCHRCHNNQSTCGRKKLKSRDTQMVKCVYCNKVQQFGEHCCDCGAKFASYYCGKCKHLTGTDDHPYHCEKCGICRIHGDRSFHCDICGVCLDVQLRGNHKCREGSAHDECCICLEDAFTGCQILPCSHKVHKECATQMIRSGITRCPICRESFAHKLERRPLTNSRKRPGK